MDPISVTASVISILDVAIRTTSALVNYVQDTQQASTERRLLAEEAKSLAALLEILRNRAQNDDALWIAHKQDLVNQFKKAHDELAAALKIDVNSGQLRHESRYKAVLTATKWSFSKSQIYSLLERVTRLQQHANTLLLTDQFAVVERVDQRQKEAIDKELKRKILNWLSPLEMLHVHRTISDRAAEGSGQWLLDSEEFRSWEDGTQKLLWCSGIPGAGKTVLSSIILNHLRAYWTKGGGECRTGIAVLYLKYNDTSQTLENLLGSLVKQLVENIEPTPHSIVELYERRAQDILPTAEEMSDQLVTVIGSYAEVFIIVDALDECADETRWELIERLREYPKIHLLVTSRILECIEEELQGFQRKDIKANKADIELFIDRQIKKNIHLRKLVQKSPGMRESIKEGVVQTAEDMFLLARLHIESLASAAGLSIRHVRTKLQTLPKTLDGTYDEAMRRIDYQEPDHRDVAYMALAWVSYACRPLLLLELQHALAIKPGDGELDEDSIMDGQRITALCAGLLTVDQISSVVNLVHYTAKSYFEKIRDVRFPGFHSVITMSCATYLTLSSLKGCSVWELTKRYPLAYYAAQHMGDHARKAPEDNLEAPVLESICQLLSHSEKRKPLLALLEGLDLIKSGFYSSDETFDNAQNDPLSDIETKSEPNSESTLSMRSRESSMGVSGSEDEGSDMNETSVESWETRIVAGRVPEVTALHLAASMGLARVASMLLKETPNIDAVDETGETALAIAIERGFEKAVEFLVNNGACIDLTDEHGRTVFLLIVEKNWDAIATIIVTKTKIETTNNDSQGRVQLLLATYCGEDKEALRLLEEITFEFKSKDHDIGALALFLAVERKNLRMIEILLSAGVGVDSKDTMGRTALHRATRRQSEDVMRLLLKFGAQVDCKDDGGHTAWSLNARSGSEYHLRILIEAGANPSVQGHNGISELYSAAAGGETAYVKFLLKSGTDPSIKTIFGWAPLHWAAYNGHTECVKLLIDAGAELSPVSDQDKTPLDLAMETNQITIISILSCAGAKESYEIMDANSGLTSMESSTDQESGLVAVVDNSHAKEGSTVEAKSSWRFDQPLKQNLYFGQFTYCSSLSMASLFSYQISHSLDSPVGCISVRRTKKRVKMTEYPLGLGYFDMEESLFDIVRTSLDYQELELQPKTQNSINYTISMRRRWTGGWNVYRVQENEMVPLLGATTDFAIKEADGYRWTTDDNQLLARTTRDGDIPILTFESGLELLMQDILMTCWIAKLWSDTVALQKNLKVEQSKK